METARSMVTVDLGEQLHVVEERVKDGSYASTDEVIQAALRAFDRGDADHDAWLVELAEEALADPLPSVPAEHVFRDLRAKYGRPAEPSR